MGKVTIFAGGFGSGKSEIAINYALKSARTASNIVLADLDMVNPYFVSRQLKDVIEAAGIRLLAPAGELSFSDVPAMPREILGIIKQDNHMIIDVAGDEVGCLALGYLRQYILARTECDFLLVLNPYRPFSQDVDGVVLLAEQLEHAAGLRFSGIISNPNLMGESTVDTIIKGHQMVRRISAALELPIKSLTVEKRLFDELFPWFGTLLEAMDLRLKPDWM
ncbi:MAG: hypothetical protein ABRQ24_05425 [Syntrophomonadaceae bacterium]